MSVLFTVARFDYAADAALAGHKRALQKILSAGGALNAPPHITLGSYEGISDAALSDWTRTCAAGRAPIAIDLVSLGVFLRGPLDTEVIYIDPAAPPEFTALYWDYHARFDGDFSEAGYPYSRAFGQPVMHSTIAVVQVDEFHRAMDYMRRAFRPIRARVVALEVYGAPDWRLVGRFELSG